MVEINYCQTGSSQQLSGPKTIARHVLYTNLGNFASAFIHVAMYAYAVIGRLLPVSWIPYILL